MLSFEISVYGGRFFKGLLIFNITNKKENAIKRYEDYQKMLNKE